jgi:glycosyltransferase involved in cell wall biosynthesis
MLILKINRNFNAIQKNQLIPHSNNKSKKINNEKIMLIGMIDSPHFHKWVEAVMAQFPDKKVLIFPSDRPRFSDDKFNVWKLSNKSIKIFKLSFFKKINFILYYSLDIIFGIRWRSYFLAKFIAKNKPFVLHFHEMQHGAYIFNLISNYKKIPNKSRKIISTWGSDLTLYSSVEGHKAQIRACFSWSNLLTTEKVEEIEDARRLGFNSEFRSPIYITLGAKFDGQTEAMVPSARKIILVKGHQSNTGRALNVLQVISKMREKLEGFEILVYSAPEPVKIQVDILRDKFKINIRTIQNLSNSQMHDLFKLARVSISLAVSDGLPGVLVEAMQSGAFPIQSENSAASVFLENGKNGFVVDPWNFDLIHDSLLKALSDDQLVNNALVLNREILIKKYNYDDGVKKLRELYL